MYSRIRPILFRLEPEQAHGLTLQALRILQALPPLGVLLRKNLSALSRPVQAFGLNFSNPVGLAAGYDKDGETWRGLACLGFGHIEVGTVTLRPQVGNPRPRLFRLQEDQALINRMGFPGKGAEFVARQLQGPRPPGLVIGVNLGKNKDTPLEEASEDYLGLMRIFASLADYLAINVSSPNTLGLRRLQGREILEELLSRLKAERQAMEDRCEKRIPILVKLAPDLSDEELEDALQAIEGQGMDGVIAANTTLSRDGVRSDLCQETGGLSGAPLSARNTRMINKISHLTDGRLPIIGVGGIMCPDDARAKLYAGATLVQVYTGLVYHGPGLVKRILTSL